jgi:hypothetical protein
MTILLTILLLVAAVDLLSLARHVRHDDAPPPSRLDDWAGQCLPAHRYSS